MYASCSLLSVNNNYYYHNNCYYYIQVVDERVFPKSYTTDLLNLLPIVNCISPEEAREVIPNTSK